MNEHPRFAASLQQVRCAWMAQSLAWQGVVVVQVRLARTLQLDALLAQLEQQIATHELFRTRLEPTAAGVVQQLVPGPLPVSVRRVDADQWASIAARPCVAASSDSSARTPSIELLACERSNGCELLVCAPACWLDARSIELMLERAVSTHAAARREVAYVDVAQWQQEVIVAEDFQAERDFLQAQDYAAAGARRLWLERASEASIVPRLEQMASSCVGAWSIAARESELLAMWLQLLSDLSDTQQVLTAIHRPARSLEELENTLGPLAVVVPVSFECGTASSFSELVERVEQRLAQYGEVVCFDWRWLGTAAAPPPPYIPWAFHCSSSLDTDHDYEVVRVLDWAEPFQVQLSVRVSHGTHEHRLELSYDTARISPLLAELLVGRLRTAMDALQSWVRAGRGAEPRLAVAVTCKSEPAPAVSPGCCYIESFARQARLTPHAIAVEAADEVLTYEQLARRSAVIARHLSGAGVPPGSIVGLLFERSTAAVASLLGVMQAGCTYLPLDVHSPVARTAYMLADSAAAAVLGQRSALQPLQAAALGARLIAYEDLARDSWQGGEPLDTVRCDVISTAAYVIYTSGSTGKPKGVVIGQHALLNYVTWASEFYRLREGNGTLVHSPLSFDLTVTSLLAPLVVGQRVAMLAEAAGVEGFIQRLSAAPRFTLLKLTPSHLQLLNSRLTPAQMASCALLLVIGGEALLGSHVRPWLQAAPAVRLVNEYGPTEATVGCCIEEVTEASILPNDSVMIGRPIAGARLFVLDGNGEIAPAGRRGDLYIGGGGLATEYLEAPDLTAQRFVWRRVQPQLPEERLYATGDVVRALPDGRLEYVGRRDQQVKIRGHRIELGEVEAALQAVAGVVQAVVLASSPASGSPVLQAFVVWQQTALGQEQLRAELARMLPDYMIPAAVFPLAALPLTANGKVDHAALRACANQAEYIAPATSLQRQLCAVWQTALGVPRVGIHDDYFRLGGDSIRSIQVVALAQAQGIDVSIAELFDCPSVARLAERLTARAAAVQSTTHSEPFGLLDGRDRAALPAGLDDAYPLSQLQRAMIYHNELDAGSSVYHDIFSYHLSAVLELPTLERTIADLVARHPALRTTFHLTGFSEPLQFVHGRAATPLEHADLEALEPEQQQAVIHRWIEAEKRRGFDIRQLPLVRFAVHRRSAQAFQFTLSFHHSVIDGWSDATMLTELFVDYLGRLAGRPAHIEPPACQYREFIELERQALAAPQTAEYWRALLADAELCRVPRSRQPQAHGVHIANVGIDDALSTRISALATQLNMPVKTLLLAAHLRTLAYLCDCIDVTTCMVTTGRPERDDGERVLGLFINSLPVRVMVEGGSWLDLIRSAFAAERAALPHRRFPLAGIKELHGGRALSETLFYFTNYYVFHQLQHAGRIGVAELIPHEVSSFPLVANFWIDPFDHHVRASLTGAAAQFSEQLLQSFAHSYRRALQSMVEAATADHRLTEFLDTQTLQVLLARARGPRLSTPQLRIEQQFEAQAQRQPNQVAVHAGDAALTYAQLARRVQLVADRLLARGVRPGDALGVCLGRGIGMVAALLGVLKTGAHYVPLNADHPAERLRYMIEDSGVILIIMDSWSAARIPPTAVACLDMAEIGVGTDVQPAAHANAQAMATLDTYAYAIYTSGSTGTPKGVCVSQRNAVNFLAAMDRELQHDPAQRVCWLALTSLSFDIAFLEIFWTLTRGGTLVLQADEHRFHLAASQLPQPAAVSLFYFAADAAGSGGDKYRLLFEGARIADTSGFEAVWIPERHFHRFGGPYPNPATLASALAVTTRNIALRAGSVVLPLHDAIRVAEEWSVVDNLSNGRAGLSVASGWHDNDFVFAPGNYAQRKQVMHSQLQLLQQLWSGAPVQLQREGKRFDVELFPKPVQQRLPIWLTSAGSPQTVREAGRSGANLLTHMLGQNPESLRKIIDLYRQARGEAGLDPAAGRVSLMIHTYVGTSDEEVRSAVREPFLAYLRQSVDLVANLAGAAGLSGRASSADIEALLERAYERLFNDCGLFGTPSECQVRMQRLRQAGVDELCCLVDFGIDTERVLDSIRRLAHTRHQLTAQLQQDESVTGLIARHQVTHLQTTPSMAQLLVQAPGGLAALGGLRKLLLGGEQLPQPLADAITAVVAPGTLMNMYGPTEAAVWTTAKTFTAAAQKVTLGRPLANTTAYVVDRLGALVATGQCGELLLGGAGIAAGYLGRQRLTAQRFIPDRWDALGDGGRRLYRTGDVVRLGADGELEFVGRNDDQVKIRGHRIEPQEVAAAVGTHASVTACTVVPHASGSAGVLDQLIAYVVFNTSAPDRVARLREHVHAKLPDYMRPATYLELPALPQSSSGKVDRRALPAPSLTAVEAAPHRDTGELTLLIRDLWSGVLGGALDCGDSFFEKGGFSLQASQAVARMRDAFALELPLRSLFDHPTPTAYAAYLLGELAGGQRAAPLPVLPLASGERVPLSPAQRGIWFVSQLESGSAYNEPAVVRIEGTLDAGALQTALSLTLAHQQALRIAFQQEPDGTPVQVVLPAARFALEVQPSDAERVEQLNTVEAFVRRAFDLQAGYLCRGLLLRHSASEHTLALVAHHLISDGWSMRVLLQNVMYCYERLVAHQTPILEPLRAQFTDYLRWQQGVAMRLPAAVEYWREQLALIDQPQVMRPDLDTGVRSFSGATHFFGLEAAPAAQARQLSKAQGVTLFMLLLAAYALTLSLRTRQARIVIGTDVANRTRAETQDVIGLFVNQLPLVVDCGAREDFPGLLHHVRQVCLNAYRHQELPYEVLVERFGSDARTLAETPLFQAKLVFQDNALQLVRGRNLALRPVNVVRGSSKFDLLLNVIDDEDGITFSFEYDSSRFRRSSIETLSRQFAAVLGAVLAQPQLPLADCGALVHSLAQAQEQQALAALDAGARALFARSKRLPVEQLSSNA